MQDLFILSVDHIGEYPNAERPFIAFLLLIFETVPAATHRLGRLLSSTGSLLQSATFKTNVRRYYNITTLTFKLIRCSIYSSTMIVAPLRNSILYNSR